jgi:hypothetical protein
MWAFNSVYLGVLVHQCSCDNCRYRPLWRFLSPVTGGLFNPTGHGWDGWLSADRPFMTRRSRWDSRTVPRRADVLRLAPAIALSCAFAHRGAIRAEKRRMLARVSGESGPQRAVAGQVRDGVPVRVVRDHEDHRVVRSAAAEGRATRIEDAAPARRIDTRPAPRVIAEIVDSKSPRHRLVFRGEGMEGGHIVVLRQALGLERARIGASL